MSGITSPQLVAQPCPRQVPLAFNRRVTHTQRFSRFLNRESAEEPQLDYARLLRVEPGETLERLVDCQNVDLRRASDFLGMPQRHGRPPTPALFSPVTSCVLYQDLAHQPCGDAIEVLPSVEAPVRLAHKPQVSL